MKHDRFVRPSRPHWCWKRRFPSSLNPAGRCAGLDTFRLASGQNFLRAMDVNVSDRGIPNMNNAIRKKAGNPSVFWSSPYAFFTSFLRGIASEKHSLTGHIVPCFRPAQARFADRIFSKNERHKGYFPATRFRISGRFRRIFRPECGIFPDRPSPPVSTGRMGTG